MLPSVLEDAAAVLSKATPAGLPGTPPKFQFHQTAAPMPDHSRKQRLLFLPARPLCPFRPRLPDWSIRINTAKPRRISHRSINIFSKRTPPFRSNIFQHVSRSAFWVYLFSAKRYASSTQESSSPSISSLCPITICVVHLPGYGSVFTAARDDSSGYGIPRVTTR